MAILANVASDEGLTGHAILGADAPPGPNRRRDQLLRAVATSLSLTTRMGDLAARLEGNEFALLLYNCGPENAQKVGQRVIKEIGELGRAYPNARVTASVGIACFTAPGPDPAEMMRLAGGALQRARQASGGVVVELAERASRAGPQSGDTSNVR